MGGRGAEAAAPAAMPARACYKLVDGKLAAVPVQVGHLRHRLHRDRRRRVTEGDKLVTRDLAGQGGPQSQLRLRMF